MANKDEIETFAFLDLETSTLPEYNYGKTSITEISIIACSKDDMKIIRENYSEIPRCVNKLTLCFNPIARIEPTTTELTGLDNYLLEKHNKFDANAAIAIKCFINHLKSPVCLVAHNGDKFDYPVIQKHFEKNKIEFPDVLCVDSLRACKTIDNFLHSSKCNHVNEDHIEHENVENDRKYQEYLLNEFMEIISQENNQSQINENEEKIDWQKINETTPKRPTNRNEPKKLNSSKRFCQNDDDDILTPPNKIFRSRRELFATANVPSPSYCNQITGQAVSIIPKNKGNKYDLSSIYERMFGKKIENGHRSESDAIALLKIAIAYGDEFFKYSKYNAKRFFLDKNN